VPFFAPYGIKISVTENKRITLDRKIKILIYKLHLLCTFVQCFLVVCTLLSGLELVVPDLHNTCTRNRRQKNSVYLWCQLMERVSRVLYGLPLYCKVKCQIITTRIYTTYNNMYNPFGGHSQKFNHSPLQSSKTAQKIYCILQAGFLPNKDVIKH